MKLQQATTSYNKLQQATTSYNKLQQATTSYINALNCLKKGRCFIVNENS
jgi:hypothetical protein